MGYGGASNVEHARDGRIAKLFEEQGQYFLFECFIEASRMATQVAAIISSIGPAISLAEAKQHFPGTHIIKL